ncbi:YcjF family protein [Rhodospirillum sp. A1_3_36]|uniref:YcjF family protein n=1 Tax=Rhodospirillum sp. A1_3_36 TaxID=3391666 RepID=UPI0039A430E0
MVDSAKKKDEADVEPAEVDASATDETSEAVTADAATVEPSANELASLERVRHHMGWSAAGGMVPVPGLDMAAVLASQLKMLSDIGGIYGVPFKQERVRHVIGALVGSFAPIATAHMTGMAVKSIPFVGLVASVLWQPALTSATTWALGKVFIQHFESGGTFLTFDPEKVRGYFKEQYEAARAGKTADPEVQAA